MYNNNNIAHKFIIIDCISPHFEAWVPNLKLKAIS